MDLLGVGALALVAAEWLALGWLSGGEWPRAAGGFWPARWALRLLVGAVLVSLAELLLALSGVGFGSLGANGLGVGGLALVLAVAALAAGGLRLVARGERSAERGTPPEMDTRERAGWLVLAVVLFGATVRSLLVPEAGWDAYSHWGLRAQAYALAGTVVNAGSEHEYYPPLVPLLEAWLYLHRGTVSIDLGKTVWALVGSAFSICLAWHLRLSLARVWLAPWLAIAIVLVTPALLDGFFTGQADLALTAFLTLAALSVFQWSRAPHRAWLVHAGLFAAAAASTKLEGAPRIAVVVLAVSLEAIYARRRDLLGPAVLLAAAAGVVAGLWTLTAARAGISSNTEHLGQFQPLAIGSIALALLAVFGGLRTGGGLLLALLTWLLAARQLLRSPLRLLMLIVVGELAATLFAFLVSDTDPAIQVRTSATRLFEQWLPLALVAGVLAVGEADAFYNRPER
jgi:hypothetical protein